MTAAISQAQYTVSLQHLRDLRCPICHASKECYRCFCRTCYFALPAEMRTPLWIQRTTRPDLEAFVVAYLAAKQFLRDIGREEVA